MLFVTKIIRVIYDLINCYQGLTEKYVVTYGHDDSDYVRPSYRTLLKKYLYRTFQAFVSRQTE